MGNTFDINGIDATMLDQFRLITDPLADQTVEQISSSGFEKQINQVFMTLVRNDSFSKDTFSEFDPKLSNLLNTYINKSSQLPTWVDQDKIKTGENIFLTYGPEIFMLLNVSSLPLCYTCAKGAKVLYDTGRLLSHNKDVDPLARRLMETAQMIVNVMSPGGLSDGGSGVVTTQKIRLIHASIRYFLKHGQYQNTLWNVQEYGEPINQEDLAGTLMSFGPVILSGLKQLNIELSQQETDAYMHCWKVVGHLMGIEEVFLPDSYEEGFELATKILTHQAAESEEGKALTNSCITFINSIVPGTAFDNIPGYFINHFLEEFSKSSKIDLSTCIGVSKEADLKDKIILRMTKYFAGDLSQMEHHALVRHISKKFNRLLLHGIIHHFNGGKNVQFFIPPSLQKNWGIEDEWNDFKTITPDIMGNRLTWQKRTQTIR